MGITVALPGAVMPPRFRKLNHTEEAHLLGSNRLQAVYAVRIWQLHQRQVSAEFYNVRRLLEL